MTLSAFLVCTFRILVVGAFVRSVYLFGLLFSPGFGLHEWANVQPHLFVLGFAFLAAALAYGLAPLFVRFAVGPRDGLIALPSPPLQSFLQTGIVAAAFLVIAIQLPHSVSWLHYLREVGPDAFEWSYYAEDSWYSVTQAGLATVFALVFILRSRRLAAFLCRRNCGVSPSSPDQMPPQTAP